MVSKYKYRARKDNGYLTASGQVVGGGEKLDLTASVLNLFRCPS